MLLEGAEGHEVQVFGQPFRDAHGSMDIQVDGDWPYEGSMTLGLPEIDRCCRTCRSRRASPARSPARCA